MNTTLWTYYAGALLKKGLHLQKGQTLVINSPVESYAFTRVLMKLAYTMGAEEVVINWRDDELTREKYLHSPLSIFETFPQWRKAFYTEYSEKNTAFLSLISADPYLLKGVEQKKIVTNQKISNEALKSYYEIIMASKRTWLVAAVATPTWASLLYPQMEKEQAYETLWNTIISMSRADTPDYEERWDKHIQTLAAHRNQMTDYHFTELHMTASNGTDLHIGLPADHIWQGGAEKSGNGIVFNANIPTEEIYTAPHKYKVNGIVYSSKPLIYNGRIIDGMRLVFTDGKVTEATATEGQEVLESLLSIDENGAYLGEVALVPYHSPISESSILFYETLFDENAACHLAFGKAYPTCLQGGTEKTTEELTALGLNDALIHVDFMVGTKDMTITGIQKNGTSIPVFINGDFAF